MYTSPPYPERFLNKKHVSGITFERKSYSLSARAFSSLRNSASRRFFVFRMEWTLSVSYVWVGRKASFEKYCGWFVLTKNEMVHCVSNRSIRSDSYRAWKSYTLSSPAMYTTHLFVVTCPFRRGCVTLSKRENVVLMHPNRMQEHTVDALSWEGDEGRGQSAISFGETIISLWSGDFRMGKPLRGYARRSCVHKWHGRRTRGSETSQYPEEKRTIVISVVAASEME